MYININSSKDSYYIINDIRIVNIIVPDGKYIDNEPIDSVIDLFSYEYYEDVCDIRSDIS
jgi:hypothetical protein